MDDRLDVTKLINIQPESGIFLNAQRVIMMDADSLGTLRRDLITALGIERTKGFLLRYGWNCGMQYAKHLKSTFSFSTKLEWLEYGPKIHEITGNAIVKLVNMKFDPITNDFYSEGHWYNSYEAEQHIKYFGKHHESICYTLLGFAGGYVSSHLGRKIIFKEVKCLGKGDSHCHWVAKSVEDWGQEIVSELPFYEEKNLGRELDKAYLRIENQNEMFKKVLTINEELSKVLLRREGLLSIISVLGKHLEMTVTIEDINFNLMEVYGQFKKHELSKFIKTPMEKVKKTINNLIENKLTVHLSIPEQFGWRHERLISPIIVNKEVLGYISLIKEFGEFNEMETISLERTSTISSIQLLNEQINIEREQKIKGDFLDELLNGNTKMEDLTYRMKLFGYNLNQPHYIYLFRLEQHEFTQTYMESKFIELKKAIADTIYNKISSMGQNCLVSNKLNEIIALIPVEIIEKVNLDAVGYGKTLIEKLQNKYEETSITLGISSICQSLKDYKSCYDEARKTIEVLKLKNENTKVLSYEQLGLIAKLISHQNNNEMKNYALELLGDIKKYDDKNDSELLKTLYYYLDNQCNLLETSRKMIMSPGAIKYRLKRIQELSKIDFKKPKDIYESYDALQILIFSGEIDIR